MFTQFMSFIANMVQQDDPILREIAVATGNPVSHLRGLSPRELLGVISRAGIPMGDIPPHIVEALGLVPLRERG